MFRYVALLFDPCQPNQLEAARLIAERLRRQSGRWRQIYDKHGLLAFCIDECTAVMSGRLLPNDAGFIAGNIFERRTEFVDESPLPPTSLRDYDVRTILASSGRRLTTHYWGNYVAFLKRSAEPSCLVLKDPTGSLPCFFAKFRGVVLFFSCIDDCKRLGLWRFTINREFLREQVISGGRNQTLNSLKEVSQLFGGECIEVVCHSGAARLCRQFHWTPMTFEGREDPIEDPQVAAAAIRATVISCTNTWASCHSSVLHRLSGGLDSSIIVGCLKSAQAPPKITCCTYFNPKGRSDERPWARLAAQHCNFEQLEWAFDPAASRLESLADLLPSVQPIVGIRYLGRTTVERELASQRNATAVFSGDGGDSGFCSDSIALAPLDYLKRHGVSPRVITLATQVARNVDLSAWTVMLRTLRRWAFGSSMKEQHAGLLLGSRLVNDSIKDSLVDSDQYPHPWFMNTSDVPWGPIRQMGNLRYLPEFYDFSAPSDSASPIVTFPLYAQPVIELLLRIPIFTHFLGGQDRGLARKAFQREVPRQILQRLWKDSAPGFFKELVDANVGFLREVLLDGILVHEQLLNRSALEEALSSEISKSTVLPGELLKHMDTELWARSWSYQNQYLAAA